MISCFLKKGIISYEVKMKDKAVLKKILQIGIVVKDVDKSVKKWVNKYRIGPWDIYNLYPGKIKDLTKGDKSADFSMKVAITNIDSMEIELIQPLDEKSIYFEFLKIHGEGLHHLGVDLLKNRSTKNLLNEMGLKSIQSGKWSNETWTYYDSIDDLGFILEIFEREGAGDFMAPEPDYKYPE